MKKNYLRKKLKEKNEIFCKFYLLNSVSFKIILMHMKILLIN